MTTKTAGQQLADTLRAMFRVGPRTRRYRGRDARRLDLHAEMVIAIETAVTLPGCYTAATDAALHAGWGTACSYRKHVGGYRIDGVLARHINELSPWQFAAMLGRMVDAGVTNTGEGEMFFDALTREVRQPVAA